MLLAHLKDMPEYIPTNADATRLIPPYVLVGPARSAQDSHRALTDIKGFLHRTSFAGEQSSSEERIGQLRSVVLALGDFLNDLGVELPEEKKPSPDRFHFFADQATMSAAIRSAKNQAKSEGDPLVENSIGLCDNQNIFQRDATMEVATHEAIHFMSRETWRPEIIRKRSFFRKYEFAAPWPVKTGYSTKPNARETWRFDFLNEAIIEMSTIYTGGLYWRNYDNLAWQNQFTPGYLSAILFTEELIQQSAATQGIGPKDIFLPLAKGVFTGEMDGLRLLSKGIEKDVMRQVIRADRSMGGVALSAITGATNVGDRLETARKTGVIEAFGWM